MPDLQIVKYYRSVTAKIHPFLRGRRVGVRHYFDHTPVFRRHPTSLLSELRGTGPTSSKLWPEKNWIYIPNKRVLREIVRQHGYEFFPHLEGLNDFWFALDIDVRAVPLSLGKVAVRTALDVLDERGVGYLLKFSGANGFHIHWAFRPQELPTQKWQFVRRIVRGIRDEVERRLQGHPQRHAFYRHIPKGDPITELNAVDKEAQKSILFDELILKKNATIRAPFSLHMKHPWVAVPIEPHRLEAFSPATDATMAAARRLRAVRVPLNPVARFLKPPWTH